MHENYKQLVIKAKDIDTRVTGRTTGHPVRAIRNEMTRHYLELEKEGPARRAGKLTLGGLRNRCGRRCQNRKRDVRSVQVW